MTSKISKKKSSKKQELQELPQSQPPAASVARTQQPVTELEQPQSLPSVTELEQPLAISVVGMQPLAISVAGMQPQVIQKLKQTKTVRIQPKVTDIGPNYNPYDEFKKTYNIRQIKYLT